MSSADIEALGDRSASGWGSVVLRSAMGEQESLCGESQERLTAIKRRREARVPAWGPKVAWTWWGKRAHSFATGPAGVAWHSA